MWVLLYVQADVKDGGVTLVITGLSVSRNT